MKEDWKMFLLKLVIQLMTLGVPFILYLSSMNREIGELKTEIKTLHEIVVQKDYK